MKLPSWLDRFIRYGRDPFQPFERGMTLQPGEETTMPLDIPFPPEIAEAIKTGKIALTFQQGDQTLVGPKRYRRTVAILLDNELYAQLVMEYTGDEGTDLRLGGFSGPHA